MMAWSKIGLDVLVDKPYTGSKADIKDGKDGKEGKDDGISWGRVDGFCHEVSE